MPDIFAFLSLLGRMLSASWENNTSQVFLTAIAICFLVAFWLINKQGPKSRSFVDNAPNIMTSLGILGTFVGILAGLLEFNTQDIDNSIPGLLEGLKIAFVTSIVGLMAAILFRLVRPLMRETAVTQSASIDDIVAGLDKLHNALTDDKDSSIVGQIQRMRTGLSDLENTTRNGFQEQINEFKEFSKTMSEAFSKAIIDELKDVIREFNEKISEQFGENFKQLNQAVGQLTAWQEQYRQQMEAMKGDLESTMTSIQANDISLKEIVSSVSNIPAHMEHLKSIMETLDQQNRAIEEGLSAFAQIQEKAINAFPEIEKNIERITENMRITVEHETQTIQGISQQCRDIMESQKQGGEQLIGEFSILQTITSESTAKIKEAVTDALNNQKIAQEKLMEGLHKSFNETITKATTNMEETIKQLDQAMENEMNKCVQTMAKNLSGITEQFVRDYEPLLESTRKIIELSEQSTQSTR